MICNPQNLIERLDSLLLCLRNQNSGADIHKIVNIRHRCIMLTHAIQEKIISNKEAHEMCLRLEEEVTAFFIDKYAHVSDKGHH